jgi:hypothetical protein
MKFTVLIRDSDPPAWRAAEQQTVERFYAQHRAFDAAVAERGTLIVGAALAETGCVLAAENRMVTDGPYAETGEQITGLYLIDVDSRRTAIELCMLLPEEYTLEIREHLVLEGY